MSIPTQTKIRTIGVLALLLGVVINSFSQEIRGKIIADGASQEYVEIQNTSTNEKTFSNQYGNFNIKAHLRDTLVLRSVFFEDTKTVVDSAAIKRGLYIQLTERRFNLAEVVISTTPFEFDLDNFNYEFKLMLQQDIAKNPFLYDKPPAAYENGLDLLALGSVIVGGVINLFKKDKGQEIPSITFEDLESLFTTNSFFTEELLGKELKINPEQKFQFFDYCEAQNRSATLLKSENQFLLLDELMTLSQNFHRLTRATRP